MTLERLQIEKRFEAHANGAIPVESTALTPNGKIEAENIVALQPAIQELYGLNPESLTYEQIKELATGVSRSLFRKAGLLSVLNNDFRGDVTAAVFSAIPHPVGKPLLNLGEMHPQNQLQAKWRQREEEIEGDIRKRQYYRGREELTGYVGEQQIDVKKKGRKPRRVRYTADKTLQRKDYEDIEKAEAIDLQRVIGDFVKPQDVVAKLLGNYDPTTLLLLLGRVGWHREGKVYFVHSAPNLRNQLFHNIERVFDEGATRKGDRRREPRRTGLPKSLTGDISNFFRAPFLQDIEFYEGGYNEEDYAQYAKDFYDRFGLIPINSKIPPLPTQIKSGSLDVVMETDRLSWIPEEQIEGFLYEMDRVLKPGGKILIREGSREQAAIEYYGEELFEKGYSREFSNRLKHPSRWIILRKHPENKPVVSQPSPESQVKIIGAAKIRPERDNRVSPKDRMGREIYVALELLKNERSDATLSLRWFRVNGFLPVLIEHFEGNIEKAIEFARKQNEMPAQYDAKASQVKLPKDAKSSYTVDDIAQELGIPKDIIRKEARSMGIRALGAATGHSGQSGFSSHAVESRRLRLSYQEYLILKGLLQRQHPKQNNEKK